MERRVVMITGGSAGVGRATAREFARSGASIGLVARGRDGLEGAKRDVESLGGRAAIFQADVSKADQVANAAEALEKEFGPLDVWVNGAMETVLSPFKEMTAEEFRRVTEVTYLGYVHGTMAALKSMLPRDHGTIIQIGSALAYRSIPLQSAYCGAKHAIKGFTDSLRSELEHDGSHVNLVMVQLPAVNTPQFSWCRTRLPRRPRPVPPVFQPEVPARAIAWVAEHPRRELFVGLSTVVTIWGNKLLPRLGDWYLAKPGYQSQQYDGSTGPDRRDNLWEPVPGDFGPHGDFDEEAYRRSPEVWAATHRGWLGLAAGVAGLLFATACPWGRRKLKALAG